jgi:putative OPT family oligopeptide transporter
MRGSVNGTLAQSQKLRTEQDLPMYVVLFGSLAVALLIWAYPGTELHLLGTILVLLFGFFFVAVAARIVGIVGSSSSPVSGMTLATILVTSVILLSFGVKGFGGMISVMSIGTVVCIAVCMSGDIAQDLKTGYLLGATPKKQQLMEFVGLLFPAIFMGFAVYLLNAAFGFVKSAEHPAALPAPQANVMATVVQGMMTGGIPWIYIIAGATIALGVELLGVSSLPFALGLYLPIELSTPIMAGGIIALVVQKLSREEEQKEREANGVLFSSGLVAGDALVGVGIALLIVLLPSYAGFYEKHEEVSLAGSFGPALALIAFAVLMFLLWNSSRLKRQAR